MNSFCRSVAQCSYNIEKTLGNSSSTRLEMLAKFSKAKYRGSGRMRGGKTSKIKTDKFEMSILTSFAVSEIQKP